MPSCSAPSCPLPVPPTPLSSLSSSPLTFCRGLMDGGRLSSRVRPRACEEQQSGLPQRAQAAQGLPAAATERIKTARPGPPYIEISSASSFSEHSPGHAAPACSWAARAGWAPPVAPWHRKAVSPSSVFQCTAVYSTCHLPTDRRFSNWIGHKGTRGGIFAQKCIMCVRWARFNHD